MSADQSENPYTSHCSWQWEEAFDKFGFDDGDGEVWTGTVADTLDEAGYTVDSDLFGIHNVVIISINKDGKELIPEDTMLGHDEPRDYLPEKIIKLLDEKHSIQTNMEK